MSVFCTLGVQTFAWLLAIACVVVIGLVLGLLNEHGAVRSGAQPRTLAARLRSHFEWIPLASAHSRSKGQRFGASGKPPHSPNHPSYHRSRTLVGEGSDSSHE